MYKFIADDTIRIDWKEQTIFGNSTSNVYKVKIDNGVLTLTDSGGKPNIYYKFDEQGERSFANARATERAANSTPIPDAAKASDVDKILIVDNANSIEDDQLKPTAQQVVDKSARLLNRRYLGL